MVLGEGFLLGILSPRLLPTFKITYHLPGNTIQRNKEGLWYICLFILKARISDIFDLTKSIIKHIIQLYYNRRTFVVVINNVQIDSKYNSIGLPQGSVLSTLLLLIIGPSIHT